MKLRFKKKIKSEILPFLNGVFKRDDNEIYEEFLKRISYKSGGFLSAWDECNIPDRAKAIFLIKKRFGSFVKIDEIK